MSAGFRRLASYIFGQNTAAEKLPMTAPVLQNNDKASYTNKGKKLPMTAPVISKSDESSFEVSFVLPASYSLDTVPKPIDPDIVLSETKIGKVAVLSFSGYVSERVIQKSWHVC